MFVLIGKSYVNIDHIVECQFKNGIVYVHLSDRDEHTVGVDEFKNDILPCLPLAKAAKKKGDV